MSLTGTSSFRRIHGVVGQEGDTCLPSQICQINLVISRVAGVIVRELHS